MDVTISSGHALKVRGAARYIDEVVEARKVTEKVAGYLKELGGKVNVYHDNVSTSQKQNVNNIVKQHNATSRDLDVSIHFNAKDTTDSPRGVEVCYLTQKELAKKVASGISSVSGLKDRGGKKRTDLGFLNNTNKPAILIEVCFVDSRVDVALYEAKFNEICRAIAESIVGKVIKAATVTEGTYRIFTGTFSTDENAEAAANKITKVTGFKAFAKEKRVWTGTFDTKEAAEAGQDLISQKIGMNPIIRDETTKQIVA